MKIEKRTKNGNRASVFALIVLAILTLCSPLFCVSTRAEEPDLRDMKVTYSPPVDSKPAMLRWVSKPMAFYQVERSTDLLNWSLVDFACGPSMTVFELKKSWWQVSPSYNGTKILAATSPGYLYTSSDSGATWIERVSAGLRLWGFVDSDPTGTYLVATVNSGYIYTSSDSGVTWVQRSSFGVRGWTGVTISNGGARLAAVAQNDYIHTSADYGATCIERTSTGRFNWSSIDSDDSGLKLGATVNGGSVWVSHDGGNTLNRVPNPLDGVVNDIDYTHSYSWSSIGISGNGTKFAVADGSGGPIRKSLDGGITWTDNGWPATGFLSLSIDSIGTNMVAIGDHGTRLLISEDFGLTGNTSSDRTFHWSCVRLSGDGKKIVASDNDNNLYIGTVGEQSLKVYDEEKAVGRCFYRIHKWE